jgi:flagellar transcriptional activator FlhC
VSVRSERQIRLLRFAQECSELGARSRTIHCITGLPSRELQRLFFADARFARRGRAPDSPEWYHGANLLHRAEASIFVSIYRRLRSDGFAAAESLLAAYRHYQSLCQPPYRISFDRAFDLTSHVEGIWAAGTIALSVVPCAACGSEHLAAVGTIASTGEHCPFCRLMRRYPCDRRLQTSFPSRPAHEVMALHRTIAAIVHDPDNRMEADGEIHRHRPPFFGDGSRAEFKNGTC